MSNCCRNSLWFPRTICESTEAADYLPFITNVFLHGSWLHLIFNMWTLWLFGPPVEDQFGGPMYLVFYPVLWTVGLNHPCRVQSYIHYSCTWRLRCDSRHSGLLHATVPFAHVVVLVPVIFIPLFFTLPGVIFAGLWFLMQVLQATTELFLPSAGGAVAWWGHIGGFIGGFALASPLRHSRRPNWPRYADQGILGFDLMGR